MDLIAVGDLMLDVRADTGALAHGGDVHGRVAVQPGGTSANAAVWAAWQGASAQVYGRVGDDVVGRLLRDCLAARGVEAVLSLDPGAPTGTMLVMHEQGERSMVADRGANARLSVDDLPPSFEAGIVLVSGYLLLQPGGHDAAIAALERAHATHVGIDAASWPLVDAFGADRFFEETATASAVLANEREAYALTGLEGMSAAAALGERYAVAAVKRGARGAVLVVDGVPVRADAETILEADPTGAGDAFDAVLLVGLLRGHEPPVALQQACHAGALVASSGTGWPVEGSSAPEGGSS
ncbi:MAG: PfkB family carbohydrate kinase [Actinomycetota bacterium]